MSDNLTLFHAYLTSILKLIYQCQSQFYFLKNFYQCSPFPGISDIILTNFQNFSKRPTAEECHEHRWLMPTEYMIKRRERTLFLGNRLKEYNEEYHEEKRKQATDTDNVTEAFGASTKLNRSTSIVDELLTTF